MSPRIVCFLCSYSNLGGHLLVNAGQAANVDEGTRRIAEALKNGEAMKKFALMMAAQGVSAANVTKLTSSHEEAISVLPKAKFTRYIKSLHTGERYFILDENDGLQLQQKRIGIR